MLKTSFLISNKDEVIKLLSKRGFDANNMVNLSSYLNVSNGSNMKDLWKSMEK